MRKTIITLIFVLPLIFVLIVFSSVKIASLGVEVSVNGIRILTENAEEGTLLIDMAEDRTHVVTAEVTPENARVRTYKLESDDPDVVEVAADGKLLPHREGTATITATSDDKGYTDSLSVVVAASRPYDFEFALLDGAGEDLLAEENGVYTASLPTGQYSYTMSVRPVEFSEYSFGAREGTVAVIRKEEHSVLLPFSGAAEFDLSVPDGRGGTIGKSVRLDVAKPASRSGILVNGTPDSGIVALDRGAREATVYVECGARPVFSSEHATGTATSLGSGRYAVRVRIGDDFEGERFSAAIRSGGYEAEVLFTFSDFDYRVTSDLPISSEEGVLSAAVLVGSACRFYAVSAAGGADVSFEWEIVGAPEEYLTVADGAASYCSVCAAAEGRFSLRVRALRGGEEIASSKEIAIDAVKSVSAVRITNDVKTDLAERFTVPGYVYDGEMRPVPERYPVKIYTFSPTEPMAPGGDELLCTVSDPAVAQLVSENGEWFLLPRGTGPVTVTAEWKWNAAFGKHLTATLELNVVADAVGVSDAPSFMQATEEGKIVVLLGDLSLGTDREGRGYDAATLAHMLKRTKSTYNTEWYRYASDATEDMAYVSYVSEIRNDVYGNGFSVDADRFTHALDGNNIPILEAYRGPLYFVKYKQMASVAGQDNCAFLIRTNGVTLYGVNLLGCKDESLLSDGGGYDLTNLNLTGTTLEINADCRLVNCRIRNGRNVVRIYGGNRDGSRYFIDSLGENTGCDAERVTVEIDGCILSQGREFLLKIGANRALRANLANGMEPRLLDGRGVPYSVNGSENWYGDLLDDEEFYRNYVMTDVTLKDSVLETSGLFTVGVESNFSGEFLYEGATDHQWRNFTREWEHSGGTSFASVLRLVGDVRLYDWKELDLVDSSTLIESPMGALSEWLKLDIKKMFNHVYGTDPALYGNLFEEFEGKKYVHGGIAFYGGGRNYSQLDVSELEGDFADLRHFHLNISVLADSGDSSLHSQGTLLPRAAGTNDFNFFLYGKDGANNLAAQRAGEANGTKYESVRPIPLFS